MQRDAGGVHTTIRKRMQHVFIEMQRGGGRRGSARVFGEHGLVALCVRLPVFINCVFLLALYVRRQWHVAVLCHQCMRLTAERQ